MLSQKFPTSSNEAILNWYIFYTYPNYEKKVQKLLSQKNIHCFLPLQKVWRQWSDRKKSIEVPLFPNYIFIKTTAHERHNALKTNGVVKSVSFDGKPVILPEKDISVIQKLVTENIEISNDRIFAKGNKIRIIDGPFYGLQGYLFEQKGKTRFGLKLESMEHSISIEISTSMIEKI